MKKLLSALLLLCLTLPLLPLSAGAQDYVPAGTAVSSEAEFLAMKSDGTYYLAADFSVGTTYTAAFSGVLNGNGKTLTVSAPLFKEFNGTVRDLHLAGKIAVSANAGIFATASRGFTAWNVTNEASLVVSGKGSAGGALLGMGTPGAKVFLYGCRNSGDISVKSPSGANYAGGLVGYADSIEAYFCENTGNIAVRSNAGYAGGICGRSAMTNGAQTVFLYGCRNSGAVDCGYVCAGILANVGSAGAEALDGFTFFCCENSGDISGALYAGGIVGYGYGSGGVEYLNIDRCVNTGTVSAGKSGGGFASQIAAYCNSDSCRITYCIGAGKLEDNGTGDFYPVFIGVSSVGTAAGQQVHDNYLVSGDGTGWLSYALDNSNSARRIKAKIGEQQGVFSRFSEEDAANGALCMAVNRAAGKNVFNQTIGTDATPTNRPGAGYVVYDLTVEEDKFINGDTPRLPLCEEPALPEDREGLAWFLAEQEKAARETEPVTEAPDTPAAPADSEPAAETDASAAGCKSSGAFAFLTVLPLLFPLLRRKENE